MQDKGMILSNSDTTMRITTLCDADEMIKNPPLDWYSNATIEALRLEYILHQLYEAGKECVIVIVNAFTAALEQLSESFAKVLNQITCAFEKTIHGQPKWYNPIDRYNYRQIHHMALRRRLRCQWRPRESRRVLNGLSPHTAVLDGDPLEEGIS